MDEYTFLVLAKLKADRLKLQREAAAQAALTHHEDDAEFALYAPRATAPQSPRMAGRNTGAEHLRSARASVRQLEWSEQS